MHPTSALCVIYTECSCHWNQGVSHGVSNKRTEKTRCEAWPTKTTITEAQADSLSYLNYIRFGIPTNSPGAGAQLESWNGIRSRLLHHTMIVQPSHSHWHLQTKKSTKLVKRHLGRHPHRRRHGLPVNHTMCASWARSSGI